MTAAALSVLAVRYCQDVGRMSEFFTTLGLSRRIASERGGYVDMTAGDGLVMLHRCGDAQTGMPAGSAVLSFETPALDAAAQALAEFEPIRWDEAYGEHLGIRDPSGLGIWINETQRDLYGYRREPATPTGLNLMAVRETTDFGIEARFYARLGFTARDGASADFAPLVGTSPACGVIGLHPPYSVPDARVAGADDPMHPPLPIRLGFETREPLDALAARLTAAGIDAVRDDNGAPHVTVTDPEGQEIEIHVAP